MFFINIIEPIWESDDLDDTKVESEKSLSNKENNVSNQEVNTVVKDMSTKRVSSEMSMELPHPIESNKDVSQSKAESSPVNNTPMRRTLGKLSLGNLKKIIT